MSSESAIVKKMPQCETAVEGTVDEAIARVVRKEIERLNLVQRLCVDVDETAEMLGCSVSQVHNLEAEGKLTNVSYDRRSRFAIEEVKGLVRKKKKAS